MILNGDEIIYRHDRSDIVLEPWDLKKVGTNSYDVALHPILKAYERYNILNEEDKPLCLIDKGPSHEFAIDPKKNNKLIEFTVPERGFLLQRGQFVLGATNETNLNQADDIVPMIEGRSSIARLGLSIHVTAGFGDIGFCGRWTLEITAAENIVLYPYMPIGQLYWIKTNPTTRRYKGKYQGEAEATGSKLCTEYK
jgi:dCTP deaminase